MIVLGIDPGTAAMGYGIVEGRGGRVRMIDCGTFVTKPDASLPSRLLAIHAFLDEIIALHKPDLLAVERLFFSRNAQTASPWAGARRRAPCRGRPSPVRGDPGEVKLPLRVQARDKEQVGRMVAVCLGMPAAPKQDDTSDALAIAIWAANAERQGAPDRRSSVLDRASVNPIADKDGNGHGNGYERAVKEALAREKAAARPKR
jgi:crossover junction endodeoxyribonuclease RuvC